MAEDTCVMVLGTSAEIACHVSRNAGGRALSQVIEVVTVETFGIVEELFLLNCSTRKLEGNKKKRTQVMYKLRSCSVYRDWGTESDRKAADDSLKRAHGLTSLYINYFNGWKQSENDIVYMKIDLWPVGNSPGFVTKLLITDYNTTSTEISKFKILIFGNAIVFKKMV